MKIPHKTFRLLSYFYFLQGVVLILSAIIYPSAAITIGGIISNIIGFFLLYWLKPSENDKKRFIREYPLHYKDAFKVKKVKN